MDSIKNSADYVDHHPLFKSCVALETLREHEDFRELEIQDLQLGQIVKFCCEFVQKRLSLEDVSLYLGISNNKKLPTLRKSCLDLMQRQFESFVAKPLFVELEFSDLQSIISYDDLQVDCEEEVFEAIRTCIRTDVQTDREDELPDLLKCVKWSQTSKQFREILLDNQEIGLNSSSCFIYSCKVEHNISNAGDLFNPNPRNEILIFGEPSSGEEVLIAEIYDPATEQSKKLARFTLREWAAVVLTGGGEVMIVGGQVDGTASSSVEVFSCREKQSRAVASLNVARAGHGACAVGDAVVVCGGYGGGRFLNTCEVFSRNLWSLLPEMKEIRWGFAVVSSPDRRVFAIGGYNEKEDWLSSVEFCRLPVDVASSPPRPAGFWQSLASMREARYGHAAVLLQGNLFVAGGWGNLSSVEMLPIANETAQWVSLPASMKEKRCRFSLLVHSRGIFAFGNFNSPFNSVERLQFGENSNSGTASSSGFPPDTFSSSQWDSLSPNTSMERIRHAVLIPRTLP